MSEPRVTKYMDCCAICGAPAAWHHLLHGASNRKLADEDGLILPLCPAHHQYSDVAAHVNQTIDRFCQIIGQLAFERNQLADGKAKTIEEARQQFLDRYGKAYV